MSLCVHPGGASRQAQGREDPCRSGENQGGAGQKGKFVFLFVWFFSEHFQTRSVFMKLLRPYETLVILSDTLLNFIHGEATKRRENRSMQRLIVEARSQSVH